MMSKKYTKKQIVEAIRHWTSVLKKMDESKSPLLDACASVFGKDVVFSKQSFISNTKNVNALFNILNTFLFNDKLTNDAVVKCMSYIDICKLAKSIYDKYKKLMDDEYTAPPSTIYGMHFAIALNNTITYNDPLVFADEKIIFLNTTNIQNKSFSLYAATLCHEMIHCYDRLHGEYNDMYKAIFVSKKKLDLHNTPTFERKMKEANDNYIDVVKHIPKHQTPEQSDDNAFNLILQSLKESENGMPCSINENTANVQLVGNRQYIIIQDFD